MIVATAGHVDHGKTSLVKNLTGTDTDRLEEEKTRGLTINLGFAYRKVDDHVIGFVDVPGHIDFINNMLAGVACVDFALLVIAADDGIMPQTREHLSILNLLGISHGAIALTKVDLVSEQHLAEVQAQIKTLLSTCILVDSPVFPVSNSTGLGVDNLQKYLQEYSAGQATGVASSDERYCRFSIDRSFVVKGIGTVVTGTVVSGNLKVGSSLIHSRSKQAVRIKGLRIDQHEVNAASKGQRVAINISINHHDVHRGDWLLDEPLLHPVTDVDAELHLIDGDEKLLKNKGDIHFYHNASHGLAQVRKLSFTNESQISKSNHGSKIWVQIKTRQPFYGLYGDRFIIRDAAGKKTLGGGSLVDVHPPPRRRHAEERQVYLESLHQPDKSALQSLLQKYEGAIQLKPFAQARNLNDIALHTLVEPMLIPDDALKKLVNEQAKDTNVERRQNAGAVLLDGAQVLAASLISVSTFLTMANVMLKKILAYHSEFPERQGLAALELKRLSPLPGDYGFFQQVLHKILALKVLARTGTLIHSPNHVAKDKPEDLAFFARLKPLLLKDQLTAPRTRELCEALKLDLDKLDAHLQRLCLSGKLAQVAANRYYLPESLLLHAEIAEQLVKSADDDMFTVIEYRDESKIGRNLCIQILEFFDRQGFTLRRSNKRLIQKSKMSLFG